MFNLWNRAYTVIGPEWSEEVLSSHRIRYSAAFGGASEIGLSKQDNTWTYPATARKLLENAFQQAKLTPRPRAPPVVVPLLNKSGTSLKKATNVAALADII